MKRLLLLVPLLFLIACAPLQDTARDSLAASKGVLQSAQKEYRTSCTAEPQQKSCVLIHQAVAAHNSALDALAIYCSNTDAQHSFQDGGPCVVDKNAAPKLKAALTNLERIITDVKGLLKP